MTGLVLSGAVYCVYALRLPPGWIVALALVEGAGLAVARVATDGFLADHVPQGMQGRVHALFSAAGTTGSFVAATLSGFLYAVEPGVPLLAMGMLYLLVPVVLLVGPAIRRIFSTVSAGHGRAGPSAISPPGANIGTFSVRYHEGERPGVATTSEPPGRSAIVRPR
jgi:MFS family permease